MVEEHHTPLPETHIHPAYRTGLGLMEVWKYRELLYFFVWRELKIRYKQTLLGFTWTILQPVLLALLFLAVISFGLGIGPRGWHGLLFYYAGMMVWHLFSQTVLQASQSVVQEAGMIRKVSFPRLILPVSSGLLVSADFCIHSALLLAAHLIVGASWAATGILIACMIASYVITISAGLGLGSLLAALNVRYRDVRYALPFLIQCLFFVTPVLYDESKLSFPMLAELIYTNPLALATKLLRSQSDFWTQNSMAGHVVLPVLVSLCTGIFGVWYFRKTEKKFADML